MLEESSLFSRSLIPFIQSVLHTIIFFLIFFKSVYRKRGNLCTQRDQIQQHINAWRQQLPFLVNAYLAWNSTMSVMQSPPIGSSPDDLDMSPPLQNSSWEIKVLDFYGELYHIHYSPSAHFYLNRIYIM